MTTTGLHPDVDEFDRWIDRAQAGEADAVVAELEDLLADRAEDPRWSALAQYTIAIAHDSAGRLPAATDAAGRCLEEARSAGSAALTATALSMLASLARSSGELVRGLDLHQQAERLLARAGDHVFEDSDWVTALIEMWVTATMLGLRLRALELGQLCRRLNPELTTAFERFVIAQDTATDILREALRHARVAPYEPDAGQLERAFSLAEDAAACTPEGAVGVIRLEVWAAVVAAWTGDAEAAVEELDRVLDREDLTLLQSLEPILRASRLRALQRLGAVERARRVCVAEREVVERMAVDDDSMAGYLWERARCTVPGATDPTSDVARLASRWEARLTSLDEVLRGVLDLHLSQDELQIRQRVLDGLTRRDELTGLLNRRGLMPLVEAAALDPEGQWALLLVDIDGFKSINDTLGHVVADDLLRLVAQGLQAASRADDMVGRIGGDEFVVLAAVPGHDPELLHGIGERVIHAVADLDTGARLRLSVGVAERCHPVQPAGWMHRADQAMYAAKRAGGNRVVVAPHDD